MEFLVLYQRKVAKPIHTHLTLNIQQYGMRDISCNGRLRNKYCFYWGLEKNMSAGQAWYKHVDKKHLDFLES